MRSKAPYELSRTLINVPNTSNDISFGCRRSGRRSLLIDGIPQLKPPHSRQLTAQVIAHGLGKFDGQVDEVFIERRRLRGQFGDDDFVRLVDKDVLTVNAQPESNVAVAENVPLVAIM